MENWLSRFSRLFGSRNEREIKKLWPRVRRINELEPAMEKKTDASLRVHADTLRARLKDGEKPDDVLEEAFALVREMSRRTPPPGASKGLRHFDVQLLGGIVLHQGKIAEMVTGEGKTLVATCPAFLNALTGKGVHVITVNDYLARRDREWMGPIYEKLGVSVGLLQSDELSPGQKRGAYDADITYGTNNEFGFDYLRDNMRGSLEEQVQRRHFAILDEVDNILIDEARTPLIISGLAEGDTRKYFQADRVARRLQKDVHFEIKEKENQAILTEEGIVESQRLVGVESFYTGANMEWPHLLEQALRAHHLYTRDDEYVVAEEEGKRAVIIVDEFTGRLMHGRRWSDGLHQAVEAKEGIGIRAETQTLATITFQNFFKLYDKLAGMTGTALTEAGEFLKIYRLDVIVVPTHRPLVRADLEDKVYASTKEKFTAVVDDILENHRAGRPVLVGTTSIEKSEKLSEVLQRRGVQHDVLNAKHHAREAEIIAQAGESGHVTIATNMAGRGTDIKLGPGVAEKGGLHVVGTERHEARRIDNQLRGRSGRQGDPGSTRFYLSFEDDLMRRFASPRVQGLLQKLGLRDGEAIEHRWVTKSVERAQRKVEERNFEIRKGLLEYDEVMNEQRTLIYAYRQQILRNEGLRELVERMYGEVVDLLLEKELPDGKPAGDEALRACQDWLKRKGGLDGAELPRDRDSIRETLLDRIRRRYDEREKEFGDEIMRRIERFILLDAFDSRWKDHLYNMDALKGGIRLRGYANEDPKIAYKREGYSLFEEMLRTIQEHVTDYVLRLEIRRADDAQLPRRDVWAGGQEVKESTTGLGLGATRDAMDSAAGQNLSKEKPKPFKRHVPKVGRNKPCPCGSGLKYKRCHGIEGPAAGAPGAGSAKA